MSTSIKVNPALERYVIFDIPTSASSGATR